MTLSSGEPSAVGGRHRVVIIGSGFGGLNAAKALKRADVDITLISKTTTHLFQPLLYQVATGILSEGDIAPTTRLILRRQKNVRVLLGEVNAIDLKAQTVTSKLMDMTTVTPYDSLIVAAGAQQSYFGNDEFATFAPGMKTIDDALELRGRILGAFEAAEVSTDHRSGHPAASKSRCRRAVAGRASPRRWPANDGTDYTKNVLSVPVTTFGFIKQHRYQSSPSSSGSAISSIASAIAASSNSTCTRFGSGPAQVVSIGSENAITSATNAVASSTRVGSSHAKPTSKCDPARTVQLADPHHTVRGSKSNTSSP